MRRMFFTLCVMAITLTANSKAAEDTNRFILPYNVRDAIFDHTRPKLYVLPGNSTTVDLIDLETRITTQFLFDGAPRSIAISPDAKRLYVAVDRGINQGSVDIYDLEGPTLVRRFNIPMQPSHIVATDSGLSIVAGDSAPSTVIGVYDRAGNQVGSSVGVWPQMRLALHPSQNIVYGVDMFPPYYYHFALSAAGVITNQWQVAIPAQVWVNDLFVLPNGSRILSDAGEFLTSTTDPQTDLKPAGNFELAPIISTAYRTNQNLLVAADGQEVRYFNYATGQPVETRSVPGARYVGVYGDRTAVLVRAALDPEKSEIRFLLPQASSTAENLPPTAIIESYNDSTILPVDFSLAVRVEGRDSDGEIQTLSVFSGTNRVYTTGAAEAYVNVLIRPGTNEIYAIVRDAFGATATSEVIRVFGNYLPEVQISPIQTVYPSVQPVTIRVTATDRDGEVKIVSLLSVNAMATDDSAPYEFVFTPPSPGTYNLQVLAEDNRGGIGASQFQTLVFEGAADNFGLGIPLVTSTNISLTASTLNATRQKGEPLHAGEAGGKSVWWSWKAPSYLGNTSGILSIDTFGSDFDTLLAVYSGGPQGTNDITKLKLLAANDDDITFAPASRVKFSVSGNDVLYIAVDGREGVGGTVKLRINYSTGPLNDSFRSPAQATFATFSGSNVGASIEPGEPLHAGNSGGASVWWKLQVSSRDPIQISTINSTIDTLLAVYTTNLPSFTPPTNFANFIRVAENDDAGFIFKYSRLAFAPPKIGTYWIAVDGYNGAQGTIRLTVSPLQGAFSRNDNFGEATLLAGTAVLVTNAYNISATLQPGEPLHAGKTNSGSLWYRWIAPTNGLVSVSTRTSDFDTVLAVYTGTNLTSLNVVAANDDDPASPPTSALIFHATAGTAYYIAVAGYGTARGEFVLALNQTPGYTPRLLSQWAQGKLWLNATNTLGTTLLEGSTNLVNWQVVQTISGPQSVEITPSSNRPQQFYRLRLLD
jgi:hypothetical protein